MEFSKFSWDIFSKTGNIDAYLLYKDTSLDEVENDEYKDEGDNNTSD